MRRGLPILTGVLLIVASQAQAASRPSLQATRLTPLSVVGTLFPRGVWIRVTAAAGSASQTKLARASVTGRFVVSFAFRVNPCRTSILVTARRLGSSTRLAQLKLSPGKCGPSAPVRD
jgi:hypothetical protein